MEFIERGGIKPFYSERASAAFVVIKNEKSEWRLVVHHRIMNEHIEHEYSVPLFASILQKQHKKRTFTVLDLKYGYHQIPLHEDSRPCPTMSSLLGLMQRNIVPIGAKNGNAGFQSMMEYLLQPVRDCAELFLDDIIIGPVTKDMTDDGLIEAHDKHLRQA